MASGWLVRARLRARRLFRRPARLRPVQGARATLMADLAATWRQRELCFSLAYQRTTTRFRRTYLGPIWIVLAFVIQTLGLALLWSEIVGREFAIYFPYITLGFYFWNFIIGSVTDGARSLIDNKNLALQTRTPMVMYPIISVMKQFVNALYNLPYVIIVVAFYTPHPDPMMLLLVIPGAILMLITCVGMAIALGVWCAYVPDIAELIGAGMRFLMFVTPVMWMPFRRAYLEAVWMANPFFHLLNVVRGPLMSGEFLVTSFSFVIVMAAVAWAAAAASYYAAAGAVTSRL